MLKHEAGLSQKLQKTVKYTEARMNSRPSLIRMLLNKDITKEDKNITLNFLLYQFLY